MTRGRVKRGDGMAKHRHDFVETYDGLVGFGFSREVDEKSLIFYLQKVSDDDLAAALASRMSDEEIEQLFELINRIMRRHLSDDEYHRLFLKD